ncbi:Y-family DNA polymerase [Shewanella halifaxensis]|uniref:Y-family DNA polymerase n=1 Tax=Shewanella halifaxensis TaxID=271098 RepID=UPI000D597B94|nr:DNA polymerase Y family protein [Shewanella halifaxensis]
MLWLAAYYPQWAFQYLRYLHQQQFIDGCVLFEPKSLQVLACDHRAAQAGIRCGMSINTAQSLLADLQLIEFDAHVTQQACDWLCQWSYGFSARVVQLHCGLTAKHGKFGANERTKPTSVNQSATKKAGKFSVSEFVDDCLVLEVSSMGLVFDGIDNLAKQYGQKALSLGLEVQLAIADTPLAAQLLALQAPIFTQLAQCSEQEVVTTSFQAGAQESELKQQVQLQQRYLAYQENKLLLDTVPVSALPVSAYLVEAFSNMGLHTFSMLAELPEKELGQRFGKPLLQLLAKIKGKLPQPMKYFEPANHYQQKLSLLYEVESMAGIAFPLKRMLEELASYLVQRQWALQTLRLSLVYRDRALPPLQLTISYPFAEHRSSALLNLCRMQLERVTLYQPVIELEIYVDKFTEMSQGQADLVVQQNVGKHNAGQYLLSSLQARLGSDKVKGIRSVAAHLPEACWQSTAIDNIGRAVSGHHKHTLALGACRPFWLLAKPEAIARTEFELLKGPERLHTHWWQQASYCRDYYIASHVDGGLCWVYQEQEGFYLHGWFS